MNAVHTPLETLCGVATWTGLEKACGELMKACWMITFLGLGEFLGTDTKMVVHI